MFWIEVADSLTGDTPRLARQTFPLQSSLAGVRPSYQTKGLAKRHARRLAKHIPHVMVRVYGAAGRPYVVQHSVEG